MVFVYQGFAHIEDVLDWSNTPEGLKETLETQPYFFKRLNQLLESLGIDTSEVNDANLSNYDTYRNKYEILKKCLHQNILIHVIIITYCLTTMVDLVTI